MNAVTIDQQIDVIEAFHEWRTAVIQDGGNASLDNYREHLKSEDAKDRLERVREISWEPNRTIEERFQDIIAVVEEGAR